MTLLAVLEDHPELREEIAYVLRDAGHAVAAFGTAADLLRSDELSRVRLLVLDLSLPDADGVLLAQRLRQSHPTMGIVMLTARTTSAERIHGLRSGADVYLCKPADMNELEAVVESLCRRLGISTSPAWALDATRMTLTPPGCPAIPITLREMQILLAMCDAPQRRCSRRRLVEALGADYNRFDDRTLENIISRLRSKLQEHTGQPSLVRAVRSFGYLFGEPLKRA